jgi:hypothetical protein
LLQWPVLPITVIASIRSNLALASTLHLGVQAQGAREALLLLSVTVQLLVQSMLEKPHIRA